MNNREGDIREFKSRAWLEKSAASGYAKFVNNRPSIAEIDLDTQIRLLESKSKPGAKVLDLGCGTGALSLRLARRQFDVTGVDISGEMLAQLSQRTGRLKINLVRANIFSLPFHDSTFDAVVSRWVLPHFSDWGSAVEEVARVLKPGGFFIFDFPSREHVNHAKDRNALLTQERLGYQHSEDPNNVDPFFYYGAETTESIAKTLSANGLKLESRSPYGLFVANSLIFSDLSPAQIRVKNAFFSWGFRYSKTLRSICEALEREITPNLDSRLVHGSFIAAIKL